MKRASKNIVDFTLIYNRYKAKVYNYVLRMVSNQIISEDIVQNVFLKLFENIDLIRNKSSIGFWIFKTARNEIYTHYRNKKIRVDQFGVLDYDSINVLSEDDLREEFEIKEIKEILMSELDSMSFEQREVFILKEYAGMSYKEIASVMEIDENLVKSRLFNTRQRLIKRVSKVLK